MTTDTVTTPARTWEPTHMAMIEFERVTWKHQGSRDSAIVERFQLTPTGYAAVVAWVIEQPEALVYDPVTVQRLRRLRDGRRAARSAR